MAENKLTLTEKFATAAEKLNGKIDSNVFLAEARNLSEKFELLWDAAADDTAAKQDLSRSLGTVFYQVLTQIKTQTTAPAVDIQTDAAVEMFITLDKLNPGYLSKVTFPTLLKNEAIYLSRAAEQQTSTLPRNSLLRASNTVALMALAASRNAPQPLPATPKP